MRPVVGLMVTACSLCLVLFNDVSPVYSSDISRKVAIPFSPYRLHTMPLKNFRHGRPQIIWMMDFIVYLLTLCPLQKIVPDLMSSKGIAITNNNQNKFGTGKGYIDPSLICQKTKRSSLICSDSWDKDHVSLLPLKGIYSIDHDVLFKQLHLFGLRLQFFESLLHDNLPLCLIRSDDTHCSLSIKQTLDNQPNYLTFRLIGKRISFLFLLTILDINKDDISILETS